MRRRLFPGLLFLAGACVAETGNPPVPVVRDSAGITIVENLAGPILDTLSWRADTSSVLRIGAVEGGGADMFGRIAGVARLSDGRIAVADAIAHEIRFFAADGTFLSSTGRRGGGPGEYQYFSGMLKLPGDSLLVLDHEGGRLTVLAPDGAFVRSFRFRSNTGEIPRSDAPSVRSVFDDGTLLIGHYLNACHESRMDGGLCQDSMRFTRDTESGDRVADYGPQSYYRQELIRLPSGRNYGFSDPYPQTFWALHGDRFYTADAARFEIRVYGASGSLERIVRMAQEPVAVPASMREPPPLRSENPSDTERQRNADLAEAYTHRTWPEQLPAFRIFAVDRAGNFWVHEYAVPEQDVAPRWLVFDSTGVLRRAVRLPPVEIVPYFIFRWRGEIGDDYVLGIVRDSDGVEAVWVVPLRK